MKNIWFCFSCKFLAGEKLLESLGLEKWAVKNFSIRPERAKKFLESRFCYRFSDPELRELIAAPFYAVVDLNIVSGANSFCTALPPLTKGVSQRSLPRDPMKTRQMGADTPLCCADETPRVSILD